MSLDPDDRVYANASGTGEPVACQWFARCSNPANGLRDAGPLGQVPICCRCDNKVTSLQ